MNLIPVKDPKRRKTILLVLTVSLAIHAFAAVGAAVWVVVKYFNPPPATFVSKPPIKIPPKIQEQKMAAAEFESMSARPSFDDRMSSTRATDFALPDLPKISTEDMIPLDPNSLVSDQISSLISGSGSGSGNGAGGGDGLGGGGDGMGTGFTFFGIPSQGKSVVIAFDVSKSVVTKSIRSGMPMEKVRDQAQALLDSLTINTSFGLLQFSRGYQLFKKELAAPTDANKTEARNWLQNEFTTAGFLSGNKVVQTNPNGIQAVLNAIFDLNPDVAYIISDADFQRGFAGGATEQVPWEDVEKVVKDRNAGRATPMIIHFLGFQMKKDQKDAMGTIIRRTGGKIKDL
jgi:hypothetical protein